MLCMEAVCYTFRTANLQKTIYAVQSLKYLQFSLLKKKFDSPCPRWLISLLALTQVNSKPESKLFAKIRLLSTLGMFNLGTLIGVLIKLWKLPWTPRVCWRTHWQNCYRSFWLWLSIERAFDAWSWFVPWKKINEWSLSFFFLLIEQYTHSGTMLILLRLYYNILFL